MLEAKDFIESKEQWKLYVNEKITQRDAMLWGYDNMDDFLESNI